MAGKSILGPRREPPSLAQSCERLERWFGSCLGEEILTQQLALAEPVVERLFGYHLLQAGVSSKVDFAACSRINHRFRLGSSEKQGGAAVADFEQLPLPSESVDVVILHHLLDFSPHPHQLLREAARVMIPGGHMVLIGFNPFSLLGLSRLLFSSGAYQVGNQLRAARVADWMTLLDLQACSIERGFFRLPLQHRELLANTSWMEGVGARWRLPWGGFYLIVARKEVASMRTIRLDWRSERKPVMGAVPTSLRVSKRERRQ
ncbi:class I SAM-dependent methyltransferase [Microbulbifer sp. TYP-18]|uniref:class I SAM-dependent methyltransferase n=1 Tax=Microbulbifer sp. TYP-18 TaxID=3230024 RepID=UPI0034C5E575